MRPLFARPSMLGAILALLVGGGAYVYMSGSDGGGSGPKVDVVFAAQDIPARSKVEAVALTVKAVPAESVHPLALRGVEGVNQAAGRFILAPVRAGEPILSADLSTASSGGDLATLVREGMRAVSIAVSDASAAGGLIAPGDHIDLIGIFSEDKTASLVASDVEILAVSKALIGTPPSAEAKTANSNPTSVNTTVTLSVTPEMAPRIMVGEVLGTLRVSLRRSGDNAPAPATTAQLNQLLLPLSTGSAAAPR